MLSGCYMHWKDHAQYELYNADVCLREIIYMFCSVKCVGMQKTFNIGIFSDSVKVINVKLCMMVLHIELCLFIALSVTLMLF